VIIVVTGGRKFTDRAAIYGALDVLHSNYPITVLRHGAAAGVDSICGQWAIDNGVTVDAKPADWKNLNAKGAVIRRNVNGEYNARAGHDRNQSMLDDDPKPDYGVVFPGGSGTADMFDRMTKAGLTIWEPYK